MHQFEKLVSYRDCGYEGVDQLLWVTADRGAYGSVETGPLRDWIQGVEFFISKVKNFEVVVQAGGNCGMYARFYRNYFDEVYTFEPDPLNYYCLDRNCVGTGFNKYLGGLGNTTSKLTITRPNRNNVGTHRIQDTPGPIQMYRIDDLRLSSCDLIHLDVEGYEEQVIDGAIKTIENFKPVVIIERNAGSEKLKSLGYKKYKKTFLDTIYHPV